MPRVDGLSDSGPAESTGQVVAAFGRRVLVEDRAGDRHPCVLSGRRLRPVCGDRVRWRPPPNDGDGVVTEILPRETELLRPDSRGRVEVIAANIQHLLVVTAPEPAPDPFLVDRYLAAGHFMNICPLIVFNKADLLDAASGDRGILDLDGYRRLGYGVYVTSAKSGRGLEALHEALHSETGILVGQSGVGKSSILNALAPGADAATQGLSRASGEGKHTTSASMLHRLPRGGAIIDSPGVRDYAPAPVEARDVQKGYIEFIEPAARCRFADCMHLKEPDCAVKQAVEDGQITKRRYESYRRLVGLMRKLSER